MKVVLIQSRASASSWDSEFHSTPSTSRFCEPLQLGYIGAVLKKEGREAKIIHQVNQSKKQVIDDILEFSPDVVGFSIMTFERQSAFDIARGLPNIKKVFGGADANANPELLIMEDVVDFLIMGEGEYSFTDLLKVLETGSNDYDSISGLVYKKDGWIHQNTPERITNLDALPLPSRDGLDMTLYKEFTPSTIPYSKQRFSSIINSRGCPHHCNFCQNENLWQSRKISRSVEGIVNEIEYLQKTYDSNLIWFWDPNPSKKDLADISNELIRRNVKVKWHCFYNPVDADLSLLQLMHDAGCEMINSGIESGCNSRLAEMRKATTIQQTAKSIGIAHSAGLFQHGSYMVGYPDESKEEFLESFRVFKSFGLDSAVFYFVTPLKGTSFHSFCEKKGLIVETNPDYYDLSHPVIKTKLSEELGKQKYQDLLSWCYKNFYDKDWLRRAEHSSHRENLMNFAKIVERRYNLDFSEV